MVKENNPQKVSQNPNEYEVQVEDLRLAISMMDEVGFASDNLKRISEATIPLDQAKIPYKLFLSPEGIRISIDEVNVTKH